MKSKRILNGAKLMMPFIIGMIPMAISTGVFGVEKNLSIFETTMMSLIVFAGAVQVTTPDLLLQNAPLWIIVATALLINVRFLMFSAILQSRIQSVPLLLKPLLSHIMTDQVLALFSNKSTNKDHTYEWLGAGLSFWIIWQIGVFVGAYLGNVVPQYLSLEYTLPITFLFFGVMMLKKLTHLITALVTIISITILYPIMPIGSGLITSIIIGACAGFIASRVKP